MTKQSLYQFILLLILLIGNNITCLADKILLKNGRSFVGIIKKETAKHVEISMGGGSISLKKSKIKSITKNADDGGTIGRLIEYEYPEELGELASLYKKLKTQRQAAMKAKLFARQFQQNNKALRERFSREDKNYQKIFDQLNRISPNSNLKQYNYLVGQMNQVRGRQHKINSQLNQSMEKLTSGKKAISQYIKELANLTRKLEQSQSTLTNIENQPLAISFWSKLGAKLNQFDQEFKALKVPYDSSGSHAILTVRINNSADGRFLLDTGASYVTLTTSLAKKLKLDMNKWKGLPLTIADGSTITGKPVILQSMRVGDVQANQVRAVVLPNPPGEGIDGLLGMSFLRDFVISFDPGNNKLVFKRFSP